MDGVGKEQGPVDIAVPLLLPQQKLEFWDSRFDTLNIPVICSQVPNPSILFLVHTTPINLFLLETPLFLPCKPLVPPCLLSEPRAIALLHGMHQMQHKILQIYVC